LNSGKIYGNGDEIPVAATGCIFHEGHMGITTIMFIQFLDNRKINQTFACG